MPTMPKTTRQWIHAKPVENDTLAHGNFALREVPLPSLNDGEALVRVKLINIHSNTRVRMATRGIPIGETGSGNYACAEVLESRSPTFAPGDIIACQSGWQEYQVIDTRKGAIGHGSASELTKALNGTGSPWTYAFRPALVKMWPSEVLMDVFGTSGTTAYFGLRECGPLRPSDRVAVAAATGSVGTLVAQLAKAAGSHVVGFAGGADRCRWAMDTLGLDACLDYRAADFAEQLRAAFPDGIDVFSDGVGGALTELVSQQLKNDGRLLSYGAAAAFYAETLTPSGGLADLRRFFGISESVDTVLRKKNVKVECWIVDVFYHERLRAEDDLSRLMLTGKLKAIHNVVDGFESLPQAITDLYARPRAGKLQVRFGRG